MDNFLLHAIVTELESLLVGHRLGRVYQLGATDLSIDFRLRDGRWLVISTDPQRLALYLTHRSHKQLGEEPSSETAFAALVKKYLRGARLSSVEKLGYDRVVKFEFLAEAEGGETRQLILVVKLIGRAANILLLKRSKILASLRQSGETNSDYSDPAPPPNKLDPFLCSAETLDQIVAIHNRDLAEAAQQHLIGFSPLYARELKFRAAQSSPDLALRDLLAGIFEQPPSPSIYSSVPIESLKNKIGRDEFNLTVAPIRLEHLDDRSRSVFPGLNEAADLYFSLYGERHRFIALKHRLNSHLSSRSKKLHTLIGNLKREREGFSGAETHQRYGELLLANLHQAVKTETGFVVTDFYDESQTAIEIPSANKSAPREAAEHYFKLARKARRGMETINARLPEIEREVAQLEGEIIRLDSIDDFGELNAFAAQIGSPVSHEQKGSQLHAKAREEKLPGVRRYRSSDGYEILVGRTDRDNDNLTFRIAKSHDLWFHAADYPGSHVVLRNPKRKPAPPRAITEAAQLAAKFSQAKGGAKVAVNYCERKFVTKMKGLAPGQVRLSSFKTVMVEPDEAGERML
jgi:predicted ribosome quality control (RQC) complex YloA/Tae2 family protein